MNRQRLLPTLTAAIAAFTLSACGLVSSADLAATVNDDELTNADLEAIVESSVADFDENAQAQGFPDPTSPEFPRLAISYWVIDAALASEAEDLGIEVPALVDDPNAFDYLNRANELYTQVDVTNVEITDDQLQAEWDEGICLLVISGSDAAVTPINELLDSGAPLSEAATPDQPVEVSDFTCFDPTTIEDQILQGDPNSPFAPIIDDLAASTPGTVHEPVVVPGPSEAETISIVVYHPRFDDLSEAQIARFGEEVNTNAQQSESASEERQDQLNEIFENNEIWVASAYGAFNPTELGVIPLG